MNKNEKLIFNAAVLREGKKTLACAQALKLLQEHGISLKEICEACKRYSIKIIGC